MLSKTVQDAINEQVKNELYSAYLYLSMSTYCESNNLQGSARWMRAQAKEEQGHGLKLIDFVLDRGGTVALQALAQPPAEFASLLDLFQQVLDHERKVTAMINRLYETAVKESDYPTQNLMRWYVDEQVEEEKNAALIVEQLKMVGTQGTALFIIDGRLGARGG